MDEEKREPEAAMTIGGRQLTSAKPPVQDTACNGPRAKIDRTNSHIKGLQTEINQFLARQPYRIFVQNDTEVRQNRLCCEVRELAPVSFGLIVGDAIHNLRTALDILANDLVVFCTGKPDQEVYFPIYNDAATFESRGVKRIEGASPAIIDLLRSVQPYNSGDNALRCLHDLDIRDKHKLIIPTVSHPAFHGFTARQRGTGGIMSIGTMGVDATQVGVQQFASWAQSLNMEYHPNVQTTFAITFGKTESMPGHEIVNTLKFLSKKTLGFVRTFEVFCFGK
jgi:hypothetical protein